MKIYDGISKSIRSKRILMFKFILTFILFSYGVYKIYMFLYTSKLFEIKNVNISRGEMVKAEEVQNLSGYRPGINIFSINMERSSRRILTNAWIKEVTIRRILPDTVEILLSERMPRAMVALDHLYYVDDECNVFKKVDPGEPVNFPVITGLNRDEILTGNEYGKNSIRMALRLLDLIERSGMDEDISEINIDKIYGLSFFTKKGAVQVKLGFTDYEEKLMKFKKVMEDLRARNTEPSYINLKYEGKAIVKLK